MHEGLAGAGLPETVVQVVETTDRAAVGDEWANADGELGPDVGARLRHVDGLADQRLQT